MSAILIVPETWLQKVAPAVGLSEDELDAMVNRMWDRGASKDEIEYTLVVLARVYGKELVFVHKDGVS
jgi:hypothetical protein